MFENYSKTTWIIIAAVIVIGAATFYGVAFHKESQQPILIHGDTNGKTDSIARLDTDKAVIAQKIDPCGGTGGTGEIVSVGTKMITIKRNDGVNQIIKIAKQTEIKNSAGLLSESDLKTGYRVTVVVGLISGDSRIASLILVCNGKSPETVTKGNR